MQTLSDAFLVLKIWFMKKKNEPERKWTFVYGRKPPTEENWMWYIRFVFEGRFKD